MAENENLQREINKELEVRIVSLETRLSNLEGSVKLIEYKTDHGNALAQKNSDLLNEVSKNLDQLHGGWTVMKILGYIGAVLGGWLASHFLGNKG